ncbi:hypothetical protein NLI96_g7191 [Meripilus lineatus]|uniref:Translation machinery associated TMA7 n=1 Tax=Meripilus lineatus TaxID=2056292 RepID=A0AAD5V4V1_9APHY|nr:hypothetical protein NLI96_g7191 [Physisporinus lineatus]
MASRQGGKLKPLKAPKKEKKDMDDDEVAFKERKKAEAEALKAARDKGSLPISLFQSIHTSVLTPLSQPSQL